MASEGFDVEEWDADFLDQLVQAEELALSTQASQHNHHQPPPPPPPPRPEISYSPPRELSQRTHETFQTGGCSDSSASFAPRGAPSSKEREVDRLKKELSRVSKRLNDLESECLDLRRERGKREEQLKELHSRLETKDADITRNNEMDGLVSSPPAPGQSAGRVQTDTSASQSTSFRSKKLLDLWNSNDPKNLLKTCEEDLHVLSSYLNSPENDSSMASLDQQRTKPIETAKVLHLYSLFTKVINDTSRLEDLLEALVDLCNLKNDFIVHWSLRVLRKILSNSFTMGKEFGKRENVIIDDPPSENSKSDTNECRNSSNDNTSFTNVAEMLKQGQILSALKLSNVETPSSSGFFNHNFATSVSGAYQASLFERVCLIATKSNEEHIRLEALSIMNEILMRHNAYTERRKFAGELVFQSLSQLLRKDAGFSVQDQAVHALYLLFNSPKVMDMIPSCLKEDGEPVCSKDINDNRAPTFQGLNEILIGLADCVACYASATAEEMKLRRNAITFLAFLGSAGKSGLQILVNHRLPKGTNFLAIILQSIISDLDLEASKSAKKSDFVRERFLLIREALILLNRLVSHPQHSVPVLQALTETREMASMTVDFANRLTQKSNLLWQDKNTRKQIRESEIMDLALVFKKRVFTYLGDNIS